MATLLTPHHGPLRPCAGPKPGFKRRVGGRVQIPSPWKIDESNPTAGEEDWMEKHPDMEGEGKGDEHQHGRKP